MNRHELVTRREIVPPLLLFALFSLVADIMIPAEKPIALHYLFEKIGGTPVGDTFISPFVVISPFILVPANARIYNAQSQNWKQTRPIWLQNPVLKPKNELPSRLPCPNSQRQILAETPFINCQIEVLFRQPDKPVLLWTTLDQCQVPGNLVAPRLTDIEAKVGQKLRVTPRATYTDGHQRNETSFIVNLGHSWYYPS